MGEQLIFEKSKSGRYATAQAPACEPSNDIPPDIQRADVPILPEVSELQVVRHYTRLSQQNFSIDTHLTNLFFCILWGSCNGNCYIHSF